MEHTLEGFTMGAAAAAMAAALSLLVLTAKNYSSLLDTLVVTMQQNPVLMESAHE